MTQQAQSDVLSFPAGWVRCAWCKEIVPYGSTDLTRVKRRGGMVYMHAKCVHAAELADWGNQPPMHGAD